MQFKTRKVMVSIPEGRYCFRTRSDNDCEYCSPERERCLLFPANKTLEVEYDDQDNWVGLLRLPCCLDTDKDT